MCQYKLKPIHIRYTFINSYELYYHRLKETTKHEHFYYIILLGFSYHEPLLWFKMGNVHNTSILKSHAYIHIWYACIMHNKQFNYIGHVTMTNRKVKLSKHDSKHPTQLITGKMNSHHHE